MSRTKKTVIRLLLPGEEEREAAFLQSMSAKGWHLSAIRASAYTFLRGEPAQHQYQVDLQAPGDVDDYLPLLEELGWQTACILRQPGCTRLYLRRPADGDVSPLYTDQESRLDYLYRVRKLTLTALLRIYPPLLLIVLPLNLVISNSHYHSFSLGFAAGGGTAVIIILALLTYSIVRERRNRL